ncbi:MAG: DUF2141 domain-containing protein [Chakrabartia sp.]
MIGLFAMAAQAALVSNPSLGIAEGRCRDGEAGPAFIVSVLGLKDRAGTVKLELYPSNDADFLEDDNILLNAGKAFRRVVVDVPASGTPKLCIRAPAPGAYSLVLLHDRDSNRKFNLTSDGIGFPGNPTLHWSKPKAAATRAVAGAGLTPVAITLQYRTGLFSFGPLRERGQ